MNSGSGYQPTSLAMSARAVRPGRDNRMFLDLEAVLWIVRTGSPRRDLPEVFGEWNSVFRRFSRWSHNGIWWRIFTAMSVDRTTNT